MTEDGTTDRGTRGKGDRGDLVTGRLGDEEEGRPGDLGKGRRRGKADRGTWRLGDWKEVYSLTDQIRRSSRSVCANLAEVWRKRRYQAAFINSLNHVESEAAETQVWLSFSKDCGYLSEEKTTGLTQTYDCILGICVKMINNPDQWVI